MAAALPKAPTCALKLGDRTSLSGVLRRQQTGFRRARSLSAAAPPVRFVCSSPDAGVFCLRSNFERKDFTTKIDPDS